MKFTLCLLAILSPVLAQAEMAGDWVGSIIFPQGDRRLVLHITGPDTALKATSDSPDQGQYNLIIPSITVSGTTFEFSVPVFDIHYSGVLNGDGHIVGEYTQHGSSRTLVLERSANAERVMPPKSDLASFVENGRFHHKATGVEFDLPAGWSYVRTQFNAGNNGAVAVIRDPSGKATSIDVWMKAVELYPDTIARSFDTDLQHEILVRSGEGTGGRTRVLQNFKIREGSVQRTVIGGNQALLAIGDFQRGGRNCSSLLAWIGNLHAYTHFELQAAAEDLPALQAPFQQMLESAKIP